MGCSCCLLLCTNHVPIKAKSCIYVVSVFGCCGNGLYEHCMFSSGYTLSTHNQSINISSYYLYNCNTEKAMRNTKCSELVYVEVERTVVPNVRNSKSLSLEPNINSFLTDKLFENWGQTAVKSRLRLVPSSMVGVCKPVLTLQQTCFEHSKQFPINVVLED